MKITSNEMLSVEALGLGITTTLRNKNSNIHRIKSLYLTIYWMSFLCSDLFYLANTKVLALK